METIHNFTESIYSIGPFASLVVCLTAVFILAVITLISGAFRKCRLRSIENRLAGIENRLLETKKSINARLGYSKLYDDLYYDKEIMNVINSHYPEADKIHSIDDFYGWAEKALEKENPEIKERLVAAIECGWITTVYDYDHYKRSYIYDMTTNEKRAAFIEKFHPQSKPGPRNEPTNDPFTAEELDALNRWKTPAQEQEDELTPGKMEDPDFEAREYVEEPEDNSSNEKSQDGTAYNPALEEVPFSESPEALKVALKLIDEAFPYPIPPITDEEIETNEYWPHNHEGPNGEQDKANMIRWCMIGPIRNLKRLKESISIRLEANSLMKQIKDLQK